MLTTWRTIDYTGPAFVYTLEDTPAAGTDSATPEDSLGLIRTDGTWKPATQPAPTSDTATVSARLATVSQTSVEAVQSRTHPRRSRRSRGQTTRLPRRARDRMSHR